MKKTILLVEDDGAMRDLIKGALESKYNILEAAGCSGALKQIRKSIDLALIDYSLPDGDGLEILEEIRNANPSVPVIMMTAYSTENLAINSFRSGATDYLRKPFTFAYLRGKLSEILEGNKNGDEPEREASREVFIIDCIAAFMEENYAEELTLDMLADKACMNRNKFGSAFKARCGRNFRPYLNTVRCRKAAELLFNKSETNISEIAYSVGYGSVDHFIREFRKAYGIPPGAYRKSVQFKIDRPAGKESRTETFSS